MSWFLAIAGFAMLVVLHEAGHFTAAKAVGMRVERFFLFFPPKLVSVRRGRSRKLSRARTSSPGRSTRTRILCRSSSPARRAVKPSQ